MKKKKTSASTKGKQAILLCDDSENNADVLYFSKIFIPDPFIAIEVKGKKIAALSPLEYARVAKAEAFDEIHSLEKLTKEAKPLTKKTDPKLEDIIFLLAKEYGVTSFKVPAAFPTALTFKLQDYGLQIETTEDPFFPKRQFKDEREAKYIREANKASEAGFRAVENALAQTKIKGNRLYLKGKPLTSEYLQKLVNIACIETGALARNTIVAGGKQGCDPHERGHGILRPNELIIVDIFPRNTKTGYHGDMTRTFLKGRPTEAQKKLVNTVRKAQKHALESLKAGIKGKSLHKKVEIFFEKAGYKTEKKGNTYQGFFHGTGHGLGLDVHEYPRINKTGPTLKKGHVVTIEPGLYYPEIGGCRYEDVAWIQKDGYKLLSKYHYSWHIA